MAHEITAADSFGETRLNGKKAWHGLGVEIPEGLTAVEGFNKIGLGWETELVPVQAVMADGSIVKDGDFKMHIRRDTKESLGVVGKDYKAISNQFLAEFADSLRHALDLDADGGQDATPAVATIDTTPAAGSAP